MAVAFLGLGTNQGDREANLRRAVELLSQLLAVRQVSPIYETEPVGYREQPWFLNMVCSVETDLSPRDLLALANRIEGAMGRTRSLRYGPRVIDIDILLYDSFIVDEPDLQIPHAEMLRRAFVLIPLAEIASEVVHPQTGTTLGALRAGLTDTAAVHLWRGD